MVKSGGRDTSLRKRLLRLRDEHGRPLSVVEVNELVMDDGVEIVALQSEAFDAAFGGRENIDKELARETADYIQVLEPHNPLYIMQI